MSKMKPVKIWRLFLLVLGLAVALPCYPQLPRGSSESLTWKAGTCPRWQPLAFAKGWAPMPPLTLDALHHILSADSDLHDEYFRAEEIGTEQTVPLLLERLRQDYPEPKSGVRTGMVCSQLHLAVALSSITNTDQGAHYAPWAAWWKENGKLSRKRWILDGFAAAGLHVADPVDERFGLELIEVLGRIDAPKDYLSRNARRLLSGVPPDARMTWVTLAAGSEQLPLRSGAVEVLRKIDTDGHGDLLTKLAADSDIGVRRRALTALNDRRSASLSADPAQGGLFCQEPADEKHQVLSVASVGKFFIIAYDDHIAALDPATLRQAWSVPNAWQAGDLALALSDRIILASYDGDVLALDLNGRVLWHVNRGHAKANRISRLVQRGDDVVLVRKSTLEELDSRTGARKLRQRGSGTIADADSAQGVVYFILPAGLYPMGNPSQPVHQMTDALRISASQNSICVTSGKSRAGRVTCLAPDTFRELWVQPVADDGGALVQDGGRAFALSTWDLTAFNARDGSFLWSTEGRSSGTILPTDYGLLLDNYVLELRDPENGGVRRLWPQVFGVSHLAAKGRYALAADFGNTLWLIDLAESTERR